MRKKILQLLKKAQQEGKMVGVTFTLHGRPGHIYAGQLLVVNESYLQLKGSHEIYFDQPWCYVNEIRIEGKVIYEREPAK